MHDEMMDLQAADQILVARLRAYGEARLTPSLATTDRMRARVMAVAHRQAALVRADASLTVVDGIGRGTVTDAAWGPVGSRARAHAHARLSGRTRRRVTALLLAASLLIGAATGTALAARPGGPLYDARIGVEALALPHDPSDRATAELERLRERLAEALAAGIAGDGAGLGAALAAYERILGEAIQHSARTADDEAAATLQDGVGRNIEVLQALVATVPDQAAPALERAIQRALDRSTDAVKTIAESRSEHGKGGSGGSGGTSNGGDGSSSKPDATPKPTKEPKPTATPKPTKAPTTRATPEPAKPTPDPDVTPRPTPKGQPGS